MTDVDKGKLEVIKAMIINLSSKASMYSMSAKKRIDFDNRMSSLCKAYNTLKEDLEQKSFDDEWCRDDFTYKTPTGDNNEL